VIDAGLEHLCHATITDPRMLRDELAMVRRRGWASSYEETNLGVWGVAVPVRNERGEVVCAVGIAGPSPRLTPERVRDDVVRVHRAAGQVADALGLSVDAVTNTKASITRATKGRKHG
jgi:DNA-binding IclR family transcriptional regulator